MNSEINNAVDDFAHTVFTENYIEVHLRCEKPALI